MGLSLFPDWPLITVLNLESAMSDRVRGARALLQEGEIGTGGGGASTLPATHDHLKGTGRRLRLQPAGGMGGPSPLRLEEAEEDAELAPGTRPVSTPAMATRDRISTLPAKAGTRRGHPPTREQQAEKPVEEASGIRARIPRGEAFPQPQPVPVDLLRYLSYAPSVEPRRAPSAPNNVAVVPGPSPFTPGDAIDIRAVPVVRVVRAILRKLDLTPNELFLLESCNGVSTVGDLVDIGIVPPNRIDAMLRRLIAANIVQLRVPKYPSQAAAPQSRDEDE